MQGPVVIDVEGLSLTEQDRRRISSPLVGMVILFSRNYSDPEQLRALCREIREVRPGLMISVDHEGGRVQRFRKGFTELPALAQYGRMYESDRAAALRASWAHGYVLAAELLSCGVNFSFAPDLDLDWGRSGVIGHRSFSSDPKTVAALAASMISGMHEAGMACCGKHFPGHGWAKADSHKKLPRDMRGFKRILDRDVRPYRTLSGILSSVMTAHVAYPRCDKLPATFSRKWLQEVLRGLCGFRGLIFSDDLAMGGAASQGSVVKRARAALKAGCDALIICNDPAQADELLAGLRWKRTKTFDRRADRLSVRSAIDGPETLAADALYQNALQMVPKTDPDLVDWEEQPQAPAPAVA